MKTEEQFAAACTEMRRHYHHACRKHPLFAHRMVCEDVTHEYCLGRMSQWKRRCKAGLEACNISADEVILAELTEVCEAILRGDWKHARYEIRDTIATLERLDDMVVAEMNGGGK